ncbi:MAG: ParB/RepB/Spo0J family partition protein [Bacteroidota bacterium]|nr:ParB/RepB/Spo0J family partition protein [Bacteroidota bacterium]
MNKFSEKKQITRAEITTDPKTFQGRQTAFSDDTVKKIVREGFDLTDDPIIVWKDTKRKKYIVISGHSRWAASEILFKKGDKRLAKMPVKVFQGTKEQAADFALLESNRSGSKEGLKSDLTAYKRAVSKGYNRQYLLGIFKPESYLNLLQKLSYLNVNGSFLEFIDSDSEKSFPYLRRNAEWTGSLRKEYPALTAAHETELFNYFYKTNKGLKITKQKFTDLMYKKVSNMYFDASKPLNLDNVVSTSAVTSPGKAAIKEIENEIEALQRDRSKKEELIISAKQQSKTALVEKFKAEVTGINALILRKIERKRQLESEFSSLERQTGFDLFSAPQAASAKTETNGLYWTENGYFKNQNAEISAKTKPSVAILKQLSKAGFKWSAWAGKWVKSNITAADREFCRNLTGRASEKNTNKKPIKIKP